MNVSCQVCGGSGKGRVINQTTAILFCQACGGRGFRGDDAASIRPLSPAESSAIERAKKEPDWIVGAGEAGRERLGVILGTLAGQWSEPLSSPTQPTIETTPSDRETPRRDTVTGEAVTPVDVLKFRLQAAENEIAALRKHRDDTDEGLRDLEKWLRSDGPSNSDCARETYGVMQGLGLARAQGKP